MGNTSERGYRVLLVHSNDEVLGSVRRFFEEQSDGFSVFTSTTLEDALEAIENERIDVVVGGNELEDTDGVELLKQAREKGLQKTAFFLFLGEGSTERAKEAIEAGVTDYLRMTMEEFVASIEDPGQDQQDLLVDRVKNIVDRERMRTNYREIFNKANDAIFVHDAETGEILDVNQRMCEMLGYSHEEAIELNVDDITPEGYTQEDAEKKIEKVKKEGPQVFEWENKTKEGKVFPVEVSLKHATIGGEDRILAIVRDISESKEYQRRLKESEERYRALVEQNLVGIYIVKEGVFEYVNPTMAEMVGTTPDDMIGTPPLEYVPKEEDRERMKENIRRREQGDVESLRYSFTAETEEGEERIFEVHGTRIQLADGPAISGAMVDMTEDVEREKRLRIQKEFTEDALDAIQDIFVIVDSEGRMVDWNQTFVEAMGYSENEINGINILDLVEGDDAVKARSSMEEVLEMGSTTLEVGMVTKEGEKVTVRWKGSTLHHPEEGEVICAVGRVTD